MLAFYSERRTVSLLPIQEDFNQVWPDLMRQPGFLVYFHPDKIKEIHSLNPSLKPDRRFLESCPNFRVVRVFPIATVYRYLPTRLPSRNEIWISLYIQIKFAQLEKPSRCHPKARCRSSSLARALAVVALALVVFVLIIRNETKCPTEVPLTRSSTTRWTVTWPSIKSVRGHHCASIRNTPTLFRPKPSRFHRHSFCIAIMSMAAHPLKPSIASRVSQGAHAHLETADYQLLPGHGLLLRKVPEQSVGQPPPAVLTQAGKPAPPKLFLWFMDELKAHV